MPSVNSLRNRFENIAQQQEVPSPEKQRVRVTAYNMPLRQSTLAFGAQAQKRSSMMPRTSMQAPTPDASESEGDTIVVNVSTEQRTHMPLPTPSESATDASSQGCSTPKMQSPVRSRSKRVSSARRSASKKNTVVAPTRDASSEKPRNISGETLVPEEVNVSTTSLLKHGISTLDMDWDMGVHFEDQKDDKEDEVPSETSSTVTVAAAEPEVEPKEDRQQQEARHAKQEEKQRKWEQRRKTADMNATRRSSRASLLMTKATEVMSAVTSTVLGKRGRDVASQKHKQDDLSVLDEHEPESKKVRKGGSTSTRAQDVDDVSLSTTNRDMRSRTAKDKKWLTSGLYAGQTRNITSEPKNKRKSVSTTPQTTTNLSDKDNYVLPLPMFAGERLLDLGRDFKLPFDVFSPLPAGHPQPEAYRKINHNVFIGNAADQWRHNVFSEHSTCMCSADTGCDNNCMNRFMYYECDDRNCNLTAEQCGNRAFEGLKARVKKGGKYNVGVEVVRTSDGRGYGVRANRCFEPGQIIVEYTGEIVTQEECENRMRTVYKENECYYLMAFDQNMIIDATRGSLARFVNHSCAPNCRMEKWTVSGKPRMALFAGDRGIMTGEELTYDYNFDPYSQKNVQVCRCGSENCRGVLGPKPKDAMLKELQKEKESKLAGAKRKLGEFLEETTGLLSNKDKKRKLDEKQKPKLPKGWAYVEPEPKVNKTKTKSPVVEIVETEIQQEEKEFGNMSDDGALTRRPSKLKRMLSQRSSGSKSLRKSITTSTPSSISALKKQRRESQRVVSASSQMALISHDENQDNNDDEEGDRPATDDDKNNNSTRAVAVANLKARAGSLKRSVGRSLRGGR
ncbi:hypothetical protein LTS08_005381 [Lithohypha guttulata]|nr:hypothetical protein LTS08_005381 [Lithohypha guttulata]